MVDCPMYGLFSLKGTLEIWKVNYCRGPYETCARYKMSREGRTVPISLLPNGKHLNVVK